MSKKEKTDLKKGSLQRRNPFNPRTDLKPSSQKAWTKDADPKDRDQIPKSEGSERFRGLHKLHSKTQVKKHPETGERMFLLHRGYGRSEVPFYQGTHTTHPEGAKTSWSTDKSAAEFFGGDYGSGVVSAWIPESAIHSNLTQSTQGGQINEGEVVVSHNKPFEIVPKKMAEYGEMGSYENALHFMKKPHLKDMAGQVARQQKENYKKGLINQKIQAKVDFNNEEEKIAANEHSKTDLKKGSLQRRNPFNPLSKENQDRLDEQRQWTHDEHTPARDRLPAMEGSARVRALNKLAAKTHVRKHPETGERLFLMHRGMGREEYKNSHDHKNGTTNYDKGDRTSWTPKYDVPYDFAGKGGGVVSAWIPESAIVHSSNQFNSPSKEGMENKNKPFGPKKPNGRREAGGRSITERDEDEFVIEHNQPFHHADKDFIDQHKDNKGLERFGLNDWGLKAAPDVRARINKPARTAGLEGQDKRQLFNEGINLKQKVKVPQPEEMNKSDTGQLIRRGLLLATLGGAAQQMTHELTNQKQQAEQERLLASQEPSEPIQVPKTEPEKAFDQAQKDAFGIAAKHLPLSRNLARSTIKSNKDLSESHGYLLHLSPSAFSEVIENNPEIKKEIALRHYDKLHETFNGDRDKIFNTYKQKSMKIGGYKK